MKLIKSDNIQKKSKEWCY